MGYISIHEFAHKAERTVPAIRHSITIGNKRGKLTAERRGKSYWLDEKQLYTFPFLASGKFKTTPVYHYDGSKMTICNECTAGKKCKVKVPKELLKC